MLKKKYVITITFKGKNTQYFVNKGTAHNTDISKAKVFTEDNIDEWVDKVKEYLGDKMSYGRWLCESVSVIKMELK